MAKHKHFLRSSGVLLAGILGMIWLAAVASAAPPVTMQAVTQAYGSDTSLQKGMIVKLAKDDATKVEPLTTDNITAMHGVVVAANDAAVTLSHSDAMANKVFVATFGRYEVLVSNQGGSIGSGDYITISSLEGVGMKAGKDQAIVLGKAVGSFKGTTDTEGTTTITNSSGAKVNLSLARILVDVSVAHNPLQEENKNGMQGTLRRIGELVSDKPVSMWRIYLALVMLVVTALIAGSLLYGGVRNGMVSIGRNPLAKRSILHNLIQVIVASLVIFIIGLFAVYLLLRL